MRANDLLKKIRLAGFRLSVDANRNITIRCQRSAVDPAILEEISKHKSEIRNRLAYENRATVCQYCNTTETVTIPIHEGRSTRLDCAKCGRFMRWGVWQGKQM